MLNVYDVEGKTEFKNRAVTVSITAFFIWYESYVHKCMLFIGKRKVACLLVFCLIFLFKTIQLIQQSNNSKFYSQMVSYDLLIYLIIKFKLFIVCVMVGKRNDVSFNLLSYNTYLKLQTYDDSYFMVCTVTWSKLIAFQIKTKY